MVAGGFFGGFVAIGVTVGAAIADGGVVAVGHIGLENEDVVLRLLGFRCGCCRGIWCTCDGRDDVWAFSVVSVFYPR